ncbi:hypothetical protein LINPERPRIM_LOCUS3297 [Linum perenne]
MDHCSLGSNLQSVGCN